MTEREPTTPAAGTESSGLAGRVALVTGASRGIGRATAFALAQQGARVMAVARSATELADLQRTAAIDYISESIETPRACERVITETRERLGPVDILINNAGIGSAGESPIWAQRSARWEQALRVNLTAPFELTRLATKDMVARRFGRIVMVSSTAGQVGGPAMTAYCSTKAGLLGLTRAVAHDVGPFDVTCNAVLPGWVRTEMANRKAEQEAEQRHVSVERIWAERAATYPARRVLEPEEIAEVIVFLCSQRSNAINGEAITVALGSTW
jgi:NAD(P)-dependent dehydrogenase (short-subunit alcohol dehydrogenase family)